MPKSRASKSKSGPVPTTRTVFVSHSVKDKASADAVVAHLEQEGVTCWIAPRDVLPGADWGESILDAIEAAKIMILIFSRNANSSSQIKREVERAVNKDTYIIPFRLDETEPTRSLEYFISTSQWMDAFPPPLEKHFQRLMSAVSAVLGNPSPETEPRPKPDPQPDPLPSPSPTPSEQPQVLLGIPTYLHQVPMASAQGPSIGMRINVPVSVLHARNKTLQVVTKFSYANGPPLWANAQEPLYRDTGGLIATGTTPRILPSDNEPLGEQAMTIPYYALNFQPTNGFASYNLAFVVFAYLDNQPVAQTAPVFFGFRW